MSAVLEAARGYLARGFAVVPIKAGQKRPTLRGWQKLKLTADELPTHFSGAGGVGIILGEPSNWLVDVDLDCDEAVEMADQFLPLTGAVSGRPSRQRSHRWYVAEECKTHQFKDTHDGKLDMVVELRSTGAQTVVGPSLHPDGEFYDMLEGEPAVVDSKDLLQAVEKLHQAVMARRYPPGAKRADQVGGGSEVEHRARLYLEKFPEAVSGEGGHNRTYRAAIALVQGFCLSENQALSALLEAYNPRCVPPWSEVELRHKVQEASAKATATNKQPRGWLLNTRNDDVDLKAFEADQRVEVVEPSEEAEPTILDPGPIPEHLLRVPGFIGELMDHCLETAPYPNLVMSFCGALAMQAFLAGRRVREEGDNRTNLYILGLAHSASGKDWPRKINVRLAHRVGLLNCIGDRFSSGEGLQDKLSSNPSMLYQTDEIDALLQSISKATDGRHESLASTLLTIYSASNSAFPMRHRAGQPNVGSIDQPCMTVFGTAIPNHYYEALSERMLTNGLFARMLVFESGPRPPGQEPSIKELPQRILNTAKWWEQFKPGDGNMQSWHPVPKIVRYVDQARVMLADIRAETELEYSRSESSKDTVGTAVWGRAGEHIRKLALIYAVSENHTSPSISIDTVAWARSLVMHQVRRMLFMASDQVATSPFQEMSSRVMRKLRSAPEGVPHSVLLKRMKMDARDFSAVMDTLVQTEEVMVELQERGGSPKRIYSLTSGGVKRGETRVKRETT